MLCSWTPGCAQRSHSCLTECNNCDAAVGVLKEIKVELKTEESKSCSCRSQPTDKYSVNTTGLQPFSPQRAPAGHRCAPGYQHTASLCPNIGKWLWFWSICSNATYSPYIKTFTISNRGRGHQLRNCHWQHLCVKVQKKLRVVAVIYLWGQ